MRSAKVTVTSTGTIKVTGPLWYLILGHIIEGVNCTTWSKEHQMQKLLLIHLFMLNLHLTATLCYCSW